MEKRVGVESRYIASCKKDFWQKVFGLELAFLVEHLNGCRDVLSVGCGPAIIEGGLAGHGFNVTGLDVSRETLNRAPDKVRTIAARAEELPFPPTSFDAVIYVASLQFVDDPDAALDRAVEVLRPGGRVIALLLDPDSGFYRSKMADPDSYVRRIRHTDVEALERSMRRSFRVEREHYLGVRGEEVWGPARPPDSALIVLIGTKP